MKFKKSHIKYLLLLIGLALLIFLLIQRIPRVFIFIGLTLLTSVLVLLNYLTQLPLDFSSVFFLSLVITSTLGFGYTVLFVILSGFIPALFIGGFKPSSFVYISVNLVLNLVSITLNFNFSMEGIILSFLYFLFTGLINGAMESRITPNLLMGLISFGINVIYFWKLGPILLSILG